MAWHPPNPPRDGLCLILLTACSRRQQPHVHCVLHILFTVVMTPPPPPRWTGLLARLGVQAGDRLLLVRRAPASPDRRAPLLAVAKLEAAQEAAAVLAQEGPAAGASAAAAAAAAAGLSGAVPAEPAASSGAALPLEHGQQEDQQQQLLQLPQQPQPQRQEEQQQQQPQQEEEQQQQQLPQQEEEEQQQQQQQWEQPQQPQQPQPQQQPPPHEQQPQLHQQQQQQRRTSSLDSRRDALASWAVRAVRRAAQPPGQEVALAPRAAVAAEGRAGDAGADAGPAAQQAQPQQAQPQQAQPQHAQQQQQEQAGVSPQTSCSVVGTAPEPQLRQWQRHVEGPPEAAAAEAEAAGASGSELDGSRHDAEVRRSAGV